MGTARRGDSSVPSAVGVDRFALMVISVGGLLALLWLGAAISALLDGHPAPRRHVLTGAVGVVLDPGDPTRAWHGAAAGPLLYWSVTVVLLAAIAGIVLVLWRCMRDRLGTAAAGSSSDGLATRQQVRAAVGARSLTRRAGVLRPGLSGQRRPLPGQLGYRLGRSRGVECWCSVEDSIVVLGPPRSGKGLHLVVPAVLDAPGAVVTTSTRPDTLAITHAARAARGPVAVFDPQRLAAGAPGVLRWSPSRGCADPQVAMARARALCAEPGAGTDQASFWSQQCYTAIRCLLHAAALAGAPAGALVDWSLSPEEAGEAVAILDSDPAAAPGWSGALAALLGSDPRQRDSTWAMVGNVFAALADPVVLDAVTPGRGEEFDPGVFLRENGTLYVLGTASGASATATLVAAFLDDVLDTARRLAAASPGARLDPPLAVILDEAANYPLPNLPALMSDGGGSGITTLVVLQSLAQARARWGGEQAAAIWDAAIVKVILGGLGNATDLRDVSALAGTRTRWRTSHSRAAGGGSSTSTSPHEEPVLDPAVLRTTAFGQAVLLLRSAPPIPLTLTPWTRRRDAGRLRAARRQMETRLASTASAHGQMHAGVVTATPADLPSAVDGADGRDQH